MKVFKCSYFQISGSVEAVESAKVAVLERLKEIDADREDRLLKSYEIEVSINKFECWLLNFNESKTFFMFMIFFNSTSIFYFTPKYFMHTEIKISNAFGTHF